MKQLLELRQIISSEIVEDNREENESNIDRHELPRYFIDSDIKQKHIDLLKIIVKVDEKILVAQTVYDDKERKLQFFGAGVFSEWYRWNRSKKKKHLKDNSFVCFFKFDECTPLAILINCCSLICMPSILWRKFLFFFLAPQLLYLII